MKNGFKKVLIGVALCSCLCGCEYVEPTNIETTNKVQEQEQENKKKKFSVDVTNTYSDSWNMFYHIEGIITNNYDTEYSYVEIDFNCYDKDNVLLGTAMDNLTSMEANGKWKFDALATDDVANIDHCDIKKVIAH